MKKFMEKKFGKEAWAIVVGIVAGILFKLLFSGMIGYLENRGLYESRYVPYDVGMLTVAVMVAWIFMGIFQVRWMEKWLRITKGVGSFMIPFTLISVATVYIISPAMWDNPMYWVVNVAVSVAFGVKMYRTPISAEED